MGNNTQENEPQSSRNSLVDLAKAIVAIAAVPLGAYTIINNFLEQPGITLGIAILTAIAASIYMVSSQRTNIQDLIIAWLTLIVITLAVFVIWPKTVTVQGTITDTANNAVPNEEVRLIDANGVLRATNTDNAGNYEFKDVPNGTFTIIVRENRIEGLAQVGAKQVSLLNITVAEAPSTTQGRIEITYPQTMKIEEADVVSVEIIMDPNLVQSGVLPSSVTGLITIETRSRNGTRNVYESEIQMYPVMIAELQAANFDFIDGSQENRRRFVTGEPIGWIWNIVAKKPGEQTFTISIYGERPQNGETTTYLSKAIALNVKVADKTFVEKVFNVFTDNIVAILSTGGPLGVIIALLAYRSNQEKQKLQQRLDDLEREKRKIQEYVATLEDALKEKSRHLEQATRRADSYE